MSDFDYPSGAAAESNVGEDLYNKPPTSGGGLKKRVERAAPPIGYHKPIHDSRLFKTYDRVEALAKEPVSWDASRDDRMTPDQAGNVMRSLVKMAGLLGEKPAVLEAYHRALFYSHTVNGASVLQPGRAKIFVAGTEFDYADVGDYLGNDNRRFHRAYADSIRENNDRILKNDDPHDVVGQEQRAMILQVAHNRGMARFPSLCHDSADACSGLSDAERTALAASKAMIFSAGVNMADRNRYRPGGTGDSAAGSMFVTPPGGSANGRSG